MSETLEALFEGRRVGRILYARDRVSFEYDDDWRQDRASFPLSLSMPLTRLNHEDPVVRPFISGLLPDDNEVLRRWGRRFQVSPRNPFRLLAHVGEECAGAVQFVSPERADQWLAGKVPEGVNWMKEDELAERISDLAKDHAQARRLGDEGQFSLAGAQAKTGLCLDRDSQRWGIPRGAIPTTHILKPNVGSSEGYELNEHYCLRLARQLGFQTARSWTERIGGIPVIIIERFDRAIIEGRAIRVHQEDCCQSLARIPELKYQNQGGPSAGDIFELIRNHSTRLSEDVDRFLDALLYNWLIGGTDAHAKNFGFLLAGGGQTRLAPLYDISSCLPYPREIPPKKAKLAMKAGGEYLLHKIGARQWEKAADEWRFDRQAVRERLIMVASGIISSARDVADTICDEGEASEDMLTPLTEAISRRAESCLRESEASE